MANIPGHYNRDVSSWRKIAAASWKRQNDPAIYGKLEADVTALLAYVEGLRERTGRHITITHVLVRALAETLRRHPDCNANIRHGRVFQRDSIDISVLVAAEGAGGGQGADLSGAVIRNADRMPVEQIAAKLERNAQAIRDNHDPLLAQAKKLFSFLPPWLLGRLLLGASRLEYDWNLNLSRLGIPRDPFGALLLTNVGSLGIQEAWAPIPPFTWVAAVVSLGAIAKKPALGADGALHTQSILPILATIDHRIIDGFQAAKLARTLKAVVEGPPEFFSSP